MNSDNFLIEDLDIEQAQDICKNIDEPIVRQKAVATALAAKLATKYFGNEYDIDVKSGLHNITEVFPELEIADIYINGNYIDVRLFFNENELAVPKAHFDNAIIPVAYMFIKLDETVSGGLVVGFILPENISTASDINGYYPVKENELVSFFEIEPLLSHAPDIDIPNDSDIAVYDFLDQHISEPEVFYNLLLKSKDTRNKLIKSFKAQSTYKYVSVVSTEAENITEDNLIENPPEETVDLTLTESSTNDDDLVALDEAPEGDILQETIENFENTGVDLLEENELVSFEDNEDENTDLGLVEDSLELEEEENDDDNNKLDTDYSFELPEDNAVDDSLLEVQDDFSTTTTPSLNSIEDDGLDENFELEEIEQVQEVEDEFLTDNEDSFMLEENDNEDTTIILDDEDNDTQYSDEEIIEVDIANETDTISLETETTETDGAPEFDLVPETNNSNLQDLEIIEEPSIEEIVETVEETEELRDDEIVEAVEDIEETNELEEVSDTTQPLDEEYLLSENVEDKSEEGEIEPSENTNEESLSVLFNGTENTEDNLEYDPSVMEAAQQPRKPSGLIPLLGIAAIIACLGYYGFNHLGHKTQVVKVVPTQNNVVTTPPVSNTPEKKVTENVAPNKIGDAMPNETIENVSNEATEVGTAVSIPAIENNLDASILVSNLRISWEVPAQYASNTVAKKYLTKIGKIIQINLKSELLLVNKAPISNKIVIELEMDNDGKLKFKNIINSSGEASVDALIKQTVNKVLDINLSINTSSLATLKGNPRLVIRL